MYEWQGIVATGTQCLFLECFFADVSKFVVYFIISVYYTALWSTLLFYYVLYKWIGLLKTLIIGPAFSDQNDLLVQYANGNF